MTSAARPGSHRRRRGLLVFAIAAIGWTLWACYPNPTVPIRNLLRYRRLPIDPGLERRTGWQLPKEPPSIEAFVDSMLVPTPDWKLYRVPWYVPTPAEVVQTLRGDCESKAVLFASLLAGRRIPYRIRASLNHIWVDYEGRRDRPGETRGIAYLTGTPGHLGIHWPSRVEWREALAIQRQQLWEAMPPARKGLWLLGLAWLAAALFLRGAPQPSATYTSRWRPPFWSYLGRASWLGAVALAVMVGWSWNGSGGRWSLGDLWELMALSAMIGLVLARLSLLRGGLALGVSPDRQRLTVYTWLGRRPREQTLAVSEIEWIQLDASAGGLRPWTVLAAMPGGRLVPLLRYRKEVTARSVARDLAFALHRGLVVRMDKWHSRTEPGDVTQPLRERANRTADVALAKPRSCDLVIEDKPGQWVMGYPASGRAWAFLLVMAMFPVALATGLTYEVLTNPRVLAFWAGWTIAAGFLALSLFLALMLRGEVVARLAGARVEISGGELRFYPPSLKMERADLSRIEAVELGRVAETPTVAVVTADSVVHIRDLCPMDHYRWVRQQIEDAILKAGREPGQ